MTEQDYVSQESEIQVAKLQVLRRLSAPLRPMRHCRFLTGQTRHFTATSLLPTNTPLRAVLRFLVILPLAAETFSRQTAGTANSFGDLIVARIKTTEARSAVK